jgi:hypothetical protein
MRFLCPSIVVVTYLSACAPNRPANAFEKRHRSTDDSGQTAKPPPSKRSVSYACDANRVVAQLQAVAPGCAVTLDTEGDDEGSINFSDPKRDPREALYPSRIMRCSHVELSPYVTPERWAQRFKSERLQCAGQDYCFSDASEPRLSDYHYGNKFSVAIGEGINGSYFAVAEVCKPAVAELKRLLTKYVE